MKNLAKILAKEAKAKGICTPWHDQLKKLGDNRAAMIQMYLKGIDFCLEKEFPSNDFIREHFKDIMEEYGCFLDARINIVNYRKCVALGKTTGDVLVGAYNVCEVFAKHNSELNIAATDNAFVEIDMFDDSVVSVHAHDRAKVHINRYGGKITTASDGQAVVKVVEKNKKTY